MEEITSLLITRKNSVYWTILSNLSPNERDASSYTGTRNGDFITIKTLAGAVLYKDVDYNVVTYVDETDPTNNLIPSSAEELQAHLILEGFYAGVDGSGGGGTGVNTFKQLLDVNVPSFTGRNNQILRIDENGQYVISEEFNPSFVDLIEWYGEPLKPDHYILTSSEVDSEGHAKYIIQSPITQVINRAFLFDEVAVVRKGYINQVIDGEITAVPNIEQYLPEYGDYCEFTWRDPDDGAVWLYTFVRWATGAFISEPANYVWTERNRMKLSGEPI